MRVLAALLLAAITYAAFASITPASAGPNCAVANADALDGEEQEMLRLINDHRRANGLNDLQISYTLGKSAAWKAQHMADASYFAHDDTPIGRSWLQRFRDCGYTYNTYTGENIAASHAGASNTFSQWHGSAGHDANMLHTQYTAVGIARAYNANSSDGWYWVTDFGGFVDGAPPPPANGSSGDVDCDGRVGGIDAALVLQYRAGLIDTLPCRDNADMNGDGVVNVIDCALMLQYAAGLYP